MKNYIKLNNNEAHLSLGNFFNVIKKITINKSSAIQTEIFCTIFDIDNISDSTVGNYCTGYRAIGNEYKQIYLTFKKKYELDKKIMIPIVNNLLSIIDGYIYSYKDINEINKNNSLKELCHKLHTYAKNDLYVSSKLKKELLTYLNKNNYYLYLIRCLFFIVLEKKQPLYETELVNETIEEILYNTNISINDLKQYLTIRFKEGISYIPSLKKLADNNNPYALHELGNLEYNGDITGKPRYEEAYNYFTKAASYDHPTSYWMLAHMIINQKIGALNSEDINLAWTYLEKAKSLNSISAINTIGLCYFEGYTKDKKKDLDKAKYYFELAAKKDYIYAYNNLGRLYESKKEYEKALSYYLKSANEEESWACNKVGLYYYNGIGTEKNLELAYKYFNIGASAPIKNRNNWNIYNLVVLFYLKGSSILGIKKDLDKSIELLLSINNLEESKEILLYAYYEKYLIHKEKNILDKVNYYLELLNNTIDKKKKEEIESSLKTIYTSKINIKL